MTSVSLNRSATASNSDAVPCYSPAFVPKRAPRWRFCIAGVACGAAMALTARLSSLAPEWLERVYAKGIGAWLARVLSATTGIVPFSVIELLIAGLACWVLMPGLPALYAVVRRRRTVANALACGAARTLGIAGVIVAVFYVTWGFNYSRAPLPARLGWDDSGLAVLPRMGTNDDREELVALCTQLVFITNHYYTVATGTPDSKTRSELEISTDAMDYALEIGYRRAAQMLGFDNTFAAERRPAKPVFASRVMSNMGVAGFYSPWTGEANFNREIPPFQLPLTIAHEKAHQRCIASEDEANFIGFLACVLSDDPYARYSGYLFAQRQLLNELIRIDPDAVRAIIALRCDGVQSDVIYSKFFWRIFVGPKQSFSRAVNDVYLRANRVDGGVLSYQMSARLLTLYARRNGGTCVVQTG